MGSRCLAQGHFSRLMQRSKHLHLSLFVAAPLALSQWNPDSYAQISCFVRVTHPFMIYMNYCKHNVRFWWFFLSSVRVWGSDLASHFLISGLIFTLGARLIEILSKNGSFNSKVKNMWPKQRRNEVRWCCGDNLAYESCSPHVRRRVCLMHRHKQTSHLHDFTRYVQY